MKASLRNKMGTVRWLTLVLGAGGAWLGVAGCSTTSILSPAAPPKEAALPAYAYLPHPAGYTSGDVRILFTEKTAPSRETLTQCETDFRALYERVPSLSEREQGVRELVSRNPAAYHWCFYSTVLSLEEGLSKDDFVDEKQKRIVNTYEYLVPIARAFMREFQDSRYLRWAIRDYRRLADLYFYRKVELSPQMSSELVDVEVPPGDSNDPLFEDSHKMTVIEKYKIGNSLPDTTFAATEKSEDVPEEKIPAPQPPVPVAKPAAENSMADTLEYANELARQRKEADSAQRAPAGKRVKEPSSPAPEIPEQPKKDELPVVE